MPSRSLHLLVLPRAAPSPALVQRAASAAIHQAVAPRTSAQCWMSDRRMVHAPAASAQPVVPPVRPELDAVSGAPTRAASVAARTLAQAAAVRLRPRELV
jgi:hypothetical protein